MDENKPAVEPAVEPISSDINNPLAGEFSVSLGVLREALERLYLLIHTHGRLRTLRPAVVNLQLLWLRWQGPVGTI